MTITTKSLEQKIERAVEQIVREHLAACEAAAEAAVRAAFERAATPVKPQRNKPTRAPAPRRSPEEIAALGERFYEVVCQQPGETMAVLAKTLGTTPRALYRPAMTLRKQGRIRAVGQRQRTRYFPMGD